MLDLRHVLWRTSIGEAFGFDVNVQRAAGDGATLSTVYQREYRYVLDSKTAATFSYAGFAAQAWADLRAVGVLDVDHEAAPPAASAVRAAYDQWAASWPAQGIAQYHVRHIRRSTEPLAAATLARLRDRHADFAATSDSPMCRRSTTCASASRPRSAGTRSCRRGSGRRRWRIEGSGGL